MGTETSLNVAYWNLHCLAQALMPLIGDEELAREALASYKTVFSTDFMARMRAKLGLAGERADDAELIDGILLLLAENGVDYTIFWRRLSHAVAQNHFEPARDLFADRAGWDQWLLSYSDLLALTNKGLKANLSYKKLRHPSVPCCFGPCTPLPSLPSWHRPPAGGTHRQHFEKDT